MTEIVRFTKPFIPRFLPIWTAAITLLVFGCSDEPTAENSVGGDLIKTTVAVHDTTIVAVSDSTIRQTLPMDGTINLMGRYGDYTAYMTMQFAVPLRDTISVLSARIRLRGTSWFGDSTSAVRFSLYRIIQSWTQPSITWDSVQLLTPFYDTTPLGTYDGSVEADTQDVFITLSDTAEVRRWFGSSNDPPKYGFILIPDPTMNVVRGFNPFSYSTDTSSAYPTLTVEAQGTSGVIDTAEYSFGSDSFVGNNDNLETDPGLLYVQGGIVYRSALTFDVTFIPRGAIINSAELLLTPDLSTTLLAKVTADTVVAAHAVVSASDLRVIESTSAEGRRKSDSDPRFSFDLRRPAQLWTNGNNYGIMLRVSSAAEFSSFDRYTFFNQNAADTLRPQLKILYTIPK